MSVRPLPDTTGILAFAIGIGVIFLAYAPIGFFSRWLGAKSRIKERTTKEEGVPVWITGNFERLLAFFLVLFHVEGVTRSSHFGSARNSQRVGTGFLPRRTEIPKTMRNENIADRLEPVPYVRSLQALSRF
jgi:hypothetical protein